MLISEKVIYSHFWQNHLVVNKKEEAYLRQYLLILKALWQTVPYKITIRPRSFYASVSPKTKDLDIPLARLKGEQSSEGLRYVVETKHHAPQRKHQNCENQKGLQQPADCWHSGRMDRAEPPCGLVNYVAKRYADQVRL